MQSHSEALEIRTSNNINGGQGKGKTKFCLWQRLYNRAILSLWMGFLLFFYWNSVIFLLIPLYNLDLNPIFSSSTYIIMVILFILQVLILIHSVWSIFLYNLCFETYITNIVLFQGNKHTLIFSSNVIKFFCIQIFNSFSQYLVISLKQNKNVLFFPNEP